MTPLERIMAGLRPITSEATYKEYLGLIDELIDCPEGAPEEELLEMVSVLVENYELGNGLSI